MKVKSSQIQAIRGMNDILPDMAPYWELIERMCRDLASRYGYQEIRFPILEQTELFPPALSVMSLILSKKKCTPLSIAMEKI